MRKLDDKVDKSNIEEKGCDEDYRNTAATMFGSVLNLDVAIKLNEVTARIFLIQHFSDRLILILSCHLKGGKIRIVSNIPVRSFDQQLANYSSIAIVDRHH